MPACDEKHMQEEVLVNPSETVVVVQVIKCEENEQDEVTLIA